MSGFHFRYATSKIYSMSAATISVTKRYGRPHAIVTDRLRSYRAAMKLIGNDKVQETGRWLNNRCENSHLPFRRREQAMLRFRHMRSLQKFVSIHSSVFNHFNKERHLNSRDTFKVQREAALAEWRDFVRHNGDTISSC